MHNLKHYYDVNNSLIRTLTITKRKKINRPYEHRNIFEFLKLSGFKECFPKHLNTRFKNKNQKKLYSALHNLILDKGVKIDNQNTQIGDELFENWKDKLENKDERIKAKLELKKIIEVKENADHSFLSGNRIFVFSKPKVPLVFVNIHHGSSDTFKRKVRFGLLLEEAFRCRSLDEFRKNAALMDFWGPKTRVSLISFPANKWLVGAIGQTAPQSSHIIRKGVIKHIHSNYMYSQILSEFFHGKDNYEILNKRSTEYLRGGAWQFYFNLAEEAYELDLGTIPLDLSNKIYDTPIKFEDFIKKIEKFEMRNEIEEKIKELCAKKYKWNDSKILDKEEEGRRNLALKNFRIDYIDKIEIYTPAHINSKDLHLLDKDYNKKKFILEEYLFNKGMISEKTRDDVTKIIEDERNSR